jgi:hypothetical protein
VLGFAILQAPFQILSERGWEEERKGRWLFSRNDDNLS